MQGDKVIRVLDKEFVISLTEEEIRKEIRRVAAEINADYEGREVIFLAVLNGSFMFAADLLREIRVPCEISFVKFASYRGTCSTGCVREVMGLDVDIAGRPVIVLEDIVDSGLTMLHVLETLREREPASIDVCTLLLKPERLQVALDVRYCCKRIPADFIVGYGLDYDGYGRELRDIYTLRQEQSVN